MIYKYIFKYMFFTSLYIAGVMLMLFIAFAIVYLIIRGVISLIEAIEERRRGRL